MKTISLLALMLFSTGCTWFKSASVQAALKAVEVKACDQESKALSALSAGIASQLNCSAPDQIQASLTAALGNANVCKYAPAPALMKPQGVVGSIVCPVAVSAAIGYMTQSLPPAWGCTVSEKADAVQAALVDICVKAVPL